MTGNTVSAARCIAFPWFTERTAAIWATMAGSAAITTLVVDGHIGVIVANICLVVAGNAFGIGDDLASSNMIDIAMTCHIVLVADHAGGIGYAELAVGNSVVNGALQRQVFSVCLGGSVIFVA